VAELAAVERLAASTRDIPARAQLAAVAWLRWRIFANNMFRRRPATKRQAMGLVAAIALRLTVWPFLASMAVGPVVASGILAWRAIAEGRGPSLIPLLAGIAVLWQFVSVNGLSIATAISNFDPSTLIRFPLRFGRYLVLRTMLGLLTASTIVGCLALLAAAIGIGAADHSLALPAAMVLAVYAAMNIFLTRMIGAWMERWLMNRHFREIFGLLMGLLVVGIQLLNFQRAQMHARGMPNSWLASLISGPEGYLKWLPPGFAGNAILLADHPGAALLQWVGLLASTALFAAVFALRLHKQFLGEYLSEGGAPPRASSAFRVRDNRRPSAGIADCAKQGGLRMAFPPIVAACLRKEWAVLRGSGMQLIRLLIPIVFIIVLNRGVFSRHPAYFLPGAIAYVLAGVMAGLYNIFGADGLGVQIYLLAPVRMRDVIVAKNLTSLALIVVEAGLAWLVVLALTHSPISAGTQISAGLWTVFVIAANLTLGTMRSIQAPRKFDPRRAQIQTRRGTPTDRTSGLLILAVLFGSLVLEIPVTYLSRYFNAPWLGALIFGPLAAGAVLAYVLLLENAEKLMMDHRDVFAEELCKV